MSYTACKLKSTRGYRLGIKTLSGTIDENGVPGRYLVRLYEQTTGIHVESKYSNDDGSFAFPLLDGSIQYFVVGFDHGANPKSAVASDGHTPE